MVAAHLFKIAKDLRGADKAFDQFFKKYVRSLGTSYLVAVLASPALPATAAELWRRLGLAGAPDEQRLPEASRWGLYPGGLPVEKGAPLFPRINVD